MVNALTPQEQHIIKHEGLAPSMGNECILKNINKLDCNILLNFIQYIMVIQGTADFTYMCQKG